jgi:hypothetical protein
MLDFAPSAACPAVGTKVCPNKRTGFAAMTNIQRFVVGSILAVLCGGAAMAAAYDVGDKVRVAAARDTDN